MAVDEVVGSDRIFEELYNGYAANVFRYALTVLGQQADAEDATQTTFLNAYRALQRGERPQQPERWLITIAHNTCRQRYRQAQRRPREVSLDEALTIAGIDDSERPTAEELKQALMHLPPAQRSALVMRELEGRSYAEAAAALQISGSALESLLFRARESIREHFAEPLSCHDAARAISMQLEGTLSDGDRRILRAHLRTCEECATLARSLRAQKRTLPGLLGLPAWIGRLLPGGLSGATATGGVGAAGLVLKTAAIVAVGAVIGGGVYEGATHVGSSGARPGRAAHHVSRPPASVSPASRTTPRLPVTSTSGLSDTSAPASPSAPVSGPVTPPSVQASGTTGEAQVSGTAAVQDATTRSTAVGSAGSGAVPVGSPAASPAALPPGQAKKLAKAGTAAASVAAKVPPGQAKKAADPTASGTGSVPPGQAKKAADATGSGTGSVPPGQAKKDAGTPPADSGSTAAQDTSSAPSVPPGQAKKDANAAPADPGTTTTATTTAPAAAQDDAAGKNVPPGQAKKSGNGH